jgi:diguanylate cyclase (GGDEF)-like protein
MVSPVSRVNTPVMTRSARAQRVSRASSGNRAVDRIGRRLGADPHVLLAVALAIPTVVVNLLERGPNQAPVTLMAALFVLAQAGLTFVRQTTGTLIRRRSGPEARWLDSWALARLALAVLFVAAAAFATADPRNVPLGPLYIPVIVVAAAIGPGEALATFLLVVLARFLPIVEGVIQPAAVTEQALVLGAVGIVLAIGTRQTVSSLNAALDRLRTTNASERRRNHQMAGLDSVGRMLASDGPEPASLQAVMDLLTGPFGYSHGSIYLGEALGGSATALRLGAQHGYEDPIATFDGSRGVIGRVIRTRQPALVPDVRMDRDYVGVGIDMCSEICVPLLAGDEMLGIVNIESDAVSLGEGDLHIIRLVTDRLASSLALARERGRLADRARLFQGVVNFGAIVNSTLDGAVLYDKIVAGLVEVVAADSAILTLLDPRDGTYRLRAFGGTNRSYLGAEIRPGEGAAGRAIRDRAPVLDHAYAPRSLPAATSDAGITATMASLAVPLIRDQVVVGAITLVRFDAADRFDELELEVVQMLGAQVALAVTNAQLHAEVMEASIRDSLTGTFNRRHFEPSLERMIAARRRLPVGDRPPLAAIMFDLDEFGAFNKFHGHQTGDAVLRAFGNLLLERFRASDLVARYGGEEFVAILEGTGRDDAFRIAEEVRMAFARQSFRGASGERLSATVSAGCAELGPTDDLVQLLGACDVGLAMAKGGGRNQVVAA